MFKIIYFGYSHFVCSFISNLISTLYTTPGLLLSLEKFHFWSDAVQDCSGALRGGSEGQVSLVPLPASGGHPSVHLLWCVSVASSIGIISLWQYLTSLGIIGVSVASRA